MIFCAELGEPEGPVALPDGSLLVVEMAPARGCVSRVSADGREVEVLARTGRPNGLAVDGRGDLFVNETMTGMIFRYRLSEGSAVRENHANVLDPALSARYRGPDGMAFDVEGRLYCAVYGQGDVTVVDPDGRVTGRIPTAGACPTNVAFAADGAPRIYVTEVERGTLEVHDVPAGGLALHAP